jgi:hypothetical protein
MITELNKRPVPEWAGRATEKTRRQGEEKPTFTPSQKKKEVKLLTRIRDVFGSNLDWDAPTIFTEAPCSLPQPSDKYLPTKSI